MKATHTVLRGIAPVVAKAPLMSGTRIHTRQYHFGSVLQLAKIVENVPALGESITEGTIAKWMKNVGDQVNIDDVIAVVETDKVTVDIKSTNAGVLTQQLAQDNIIVGEPLFEIDTDGTGAVASPSPAPSPAAAPIATSAPVSPPPTKSGHRVPLIKFLGKRSLLPKKAPATSAPSPAAAPAFKPTAKPIKEGTGVPFQTLKDKGGAYFGRPRLSEKEIEAINNGF